MPILKFPNPRQTTSEGIVALGGDLEPESLLLAYRQGIFPWPMEGIPLPWFCPPHRAILEKDRLHIPKSLSRAFKKASFTYTIDRCFSKVIHHCQAAFRPGQKGTWITEEMGQAYNRLHQLGYAHSIEVWNQDRLVGGIYGVDAGGVFSGESMFHLESNASKCGILFLLDYLETRGLTWIDIQTLTPHMENLGAREIPRDDFLERLEKTLAQGLMLFSEKNPIFSSASETESK